MSVMENVGLVVTTPASGLVVTVEEVRKQLRLQTTSEDESVRTYIAAATGTVEAFLNRQLLEATLTQTLPRFPSGADSIRLRRTPLVSVTSIFYIESDGSSTEFVTANQWTAVIDKEPGLVALQFDVDWPETRAQPVNPVTIIYKAGYGGQSKDVPPEIRLCVIAASAHYFEHRMMEGDFPPAIHEMLWPYRVVDHREM